MAPGAGVVGANSAAAISAAEKSAAAFAPADVEFMQGMIPHHAQAVIMARWAATHGARADIRDDGMAPPADPIVTPRIGIKKAADWPRRWLAV